MSLWRKNARLLCNAPGTPVRVPVRTELEQTEESGEDVSTHADLQNADICPTCTQAIVEAAVDTEGQEAILCEGSCNCWYHRWCMRGSVNATLQGPFHVRGALPMSFVHG